MTTQNPDNAAGLKLTPSQRLLEPEMRPVAEFVEEVDAAPYVKILGQRFGMPASAFDRFLVHRPNRETVWIVDRTLRLPNRPKPFSLGFPFFYWKMEYPRPTTAAAVHFGPLATCNLFDIQDEELSLLIYRKEIFFKDSRLQVLESNGYLLLRHRGLFLGVGYFRPDPELGGAVKSILPRSWTSRLGVPHPEGPPISSP